jgi:hypothetical protein
MGETCMGKYPAAEKPYRGKSMEMYFLLCPPIAQSSGRFKMVYFPIKQWLPRASYYIQHFDNDPVRGHLLRALSKKDIPMLSLSFFHE